MYLLFCNKYLYIYLAYTQAEEYRQIYHLIKITFYYQSLGEPNLKLDGNLYKHKVGESSNGIDTNLGGRLKCRERIDYVGMMTAIQFNIVCFNGVIIILFKLRKFNNFGLLCLCQLFQESPYYIFNQFINFNAKLQREKSTDS